MEHAGKIVLLVGLLVVILGFVLMYSDKIPFLGKLPGDISIKRDDNQIHFPIATSIVLSALISIVFWIVSQFKEK